MRLNIALLTVALVATTLSIAPSFAEEATSTTPATKCPVTTGADGKPICDYTMKKGHGAAGHTHPDGVKCDPANCPIDGEKAAKCDPANCPIDGEKAAKCDPANCPVEKCAAPNEGKRCAYDKNMSEATPEATPAE